MSEEVRAMVSFGPGNIRMQRFPYPESLPDDALIAKMRMAGICGTDHHIYSGHLEHIPWPIIQGHEVIAEAHEVGNKAAKQLEIHGLTLEEGDRFTYPAGISCGKCWYCRWLASVMRAGLCENGVAYGENISCKDPPHLFGGFAEYIYIRPDLLLYRLPKDIPDKVAVLVDTLSSSWGIDRAISPLPVAREGFMWGCSALVLGSGPVGMMAALRFKEYGASKVIMIGGPDFRLKHAQKCGVDHTMNIDEVAKPEDRIREVTRLTDGRGADVVIEAAGVPAAFAEGVEMVRRGGTYVEVGHYTDAGSTMLNPFRVCFKDLTLISQYGFGAYQYERDLQLLYKWYRNKEYPLEEIVTNEYKLENLEEGLKAHKAWKTMKCVVLPQ